MPYLIVNDESYDVLFTAGMKIEVVNFFHQRETLYEDVSNEGIYDVSFYTLSAQVEKILAMVFSKQGML